MYFPYVDRLDLINRLFLYWFSEPCVDTELAFGQCRLGVRGTCGLKQPLVPPADNVITGLEIPVDLSM